MIKANARLTIARLPIRELVIWECQSRYPERLLHYIRLLQEHPDDDPGLISVEPHREHEGMYNVMDGHHRLLASIMTGRSDVLCLIVEEAGAKSSTTP